MKYWKLINGMAAFAAFACSCMVKVPDTAGLVHAAVKGTEVDIDASVFPDDNFREMIAKQVDTDGDGKLSDTEIADVTRLDLQYPHQESHPWYGASLSDLYDYPDLEHHYDGVAMDMTGLELFKNLERLRIHNAEPVNLSLEHLEQLDFLELSSTPEMELDLSNTRNLCEVAVAEASLSEIRLDQNTQLQHIRLYHICAPRTVLNLTALPKLVSVTVEHSELAGMELGKKPQLTDLQADCGLADIDLSGCPQLERARLDGNRLKTLDISGNQKLQYVYLKDNQLSRLDVRQNGQLEVLDISGNVFSKINSRTLCIGKNSTLSFLQAGNLNQCTTLDVSHLFALEELQAPYGAFTKVSIAKKLLSLDISSSKLVTLNAKTLRAPAGAALAELHCSTGKLKKINASHLKNLKQIAAGSNKLTDVNISGCLKMQSCYLNGNPLKKLTVSKKSSSSQKKQYQKTIKETGGKLVFQ